MEMKVVMTDAFTYEDIKQLSSGDSIKEALVAEREQFKKAQEKILENLVDEASYEFNDFEDEYIIADYETRLSEVGFENPEISYSGFYSQGDGACFTADLNLELLFEKFAKENNISGKENGSIMDLYRLLQEMNAFEYFEGKIINLSNHYSHSSTKRADVVVDTFEILEIPVNTEKHFFEISDDGTSIGIDLLLNIIFRLEKDGKQNKLCSVIEFRNTIGVEFPKWVESLRKSMSDELYDFLQETYENWTSPDEVEARFLEDERSKKILFDKYGNELLSDIDSGCESGYFNGLKVYYKD